MLCFLILKFFMENAERFYENPAMVSARAWSTYATWKMREFNEMEHFLESRLGLSITAAEKYISHFPNFILIHIGKFVSFVIGSLFALLLIIALWDWDLMEKVHIYGQSCLWWLAILTIALRISRGVVQDIKTLNPEIAMEDVVKHTHYLPRHWRGRAHTKEVN